MENFPPFVETEDSLPCSQEPTAGPYPQPVHIVTSHFKIKFNITVVHECYMSYQFRLLYLMELKILLKLKSSEWWYYVISEMITMVWGYLLPQNEL